MKTMLRTPVVLSLLAAFAACTTGADDMNDGMLGDDGFGGDAAGDGDGDGDGDGAGDGDGDGDGTGDGDGDGDWTPGGDPVTGRVIGYYPSWAIYARDYHVPDIPGDKLTHINYAFANLDAQGRCVLGDAYADIDKAYDGDTWDAGVLRGSFNQLNKLKAKHPQLKTMISVGGWTWSTEFSDAASTAAGRQELASSCVAFMREYGFDGIDIDWEYPVGGGLETNGNDPADKQNYTLLLAELRAQLDAAGSQDGQHYELSIAAPAGPDIIANLELGKMHAYLDFINVMAYDLHGAWRDVTNHNAPMYGSAIDPTPGSMELSVDAALDTYLAAGIPSDKVVMGVPFYGRGYSGVSGGQDGLFASFGDIPMGTWEKGIVDYWDIVDNYEPVMDKFWDDNAKVPYLYDASTGLMISYDDEQSIGLKAEYVRDNQLGGIMFWDLTGDEREGGLLDTINAVIEP